MSGTRVSGTRIIPPSAQNGQGSSNQFIQSPYGNIQLVTSATGHLVVSNSFTTVGTTGNTNPNVGSSCSPQGQDPMGIDQGTYYSTTAQRQMAQAYFGGGVGVEKDLAVGGYIYGRLARATNGGISTATDSIFVYSTSSNQDYYISFTDSLNSDAYLWGNAALTYNAATGRLTASKVLISSTTATTSTDSGALVVDGGVGIGGDITLGGVLYAGETFADDYLTTVYENFLKLPASSGNVAIGAGTTDVFGDLRVRGKNPIGTAPVVTNILYVTMDGDDTNDGRAQDPSRACRTISGAIRSPFYQSGTQIKVSPGKYLENNPILLKPYTSVVGSDLRTTSIVPINKTQDLFHLTSGCYLSNMQFLNGRSGLLPGRYDTGYNRGAYATAFPISTSTSTTSLIDIYHSPYIQNCTNLTGPWLKDGTLFVPNQTVQLPLAVGTGTWIANTSSIVITTSSGQITVGMTINQGKQNSGFFNARTLLLANKKFLQEQIIKWISTTYPSFVYNTAYCYRDVGIIVENVAYDAAFGGNANSVASGLAYWRGTTSVIQGETTQTVAAINQLLTWCLDIIANTSTGLSAITTAQVINTALTGGGVATSSITALFGIITSIITTGPSAAPDVYNGAGPDAAYVSAEVLLQSNRSFIQDQVVSYINNKYPTFTYNTTACFRDVGLIVDAVSQDILLGGNQRSVEAGLAYWNYGVNAVATEITTTTDAISYARDISLEIIGNVEASLAPGSTSSQVLNTFYQYGNAYIPRQAVTRNYNIINSIIKNGPSAAPVVYEGSSLFAATGVNAADTRVATTVTSVTTQSSGVYRIGLSTPTIGSGTNATLYFGNTYGWPLQDSDMDALSYSVTGNTSTWASRKVDPIGGMGGSLVDGSQVSARSPVQSFVYDAFTQLSQGGIGVRVTNNGYAQLVSVFTIFCDTAVQVDNGGIVSITNSNSNFGRLALVANGYGPRKFSGTVYNPANRAYPFSPGLLDPYYPNGFWPSKGSLVEIFTPDLINRPHISLIMEVVPPTTYTNKAGLPGFLNAQPSTSTFTTGTVTITGLSTNGVYVGNSVYITDGLGSQTDSNGVLYTATGTTVIDVQYNSITLNQALTSGGSSNDPTYFTMYVSGNAYYTVLTSEVATQPYAPGTNILAANTDPNFQGPTVSQIAAHLDVLTYMNTLVSAVVSNTTFTTSAGTTSTQVKDTNRTHGSSATTFISNEFTTIKNIVGAANLTAAQAVVPQASITTSGPDVPGAGDAIVLIEKNINFISDEIYHYILDTSADNTALNASTSSYQYNKCARDVALILQQLIYDLQSGGNYNAVYSGLSYWSRPGTYHIVELEEYVTDNNLFPDGATVNFYQRSYISASGYLFEYVGAGSNYGALPQNGVADPIQAQETVALNGGKVFFTSTDQNGDFRIGPELVISQANGVISGRAFTQSLFANMTPFILAIEGGS